MSGDLCKSFKVHDCTVQLNGIVRGEDGVIVGRLEELGKLRKRNAELVDFVIWMTGCGYDFCQHEYYIQQRAKLLKDNPTPPPDKAVACEEESKRCPPEFDEILWRVFRQGGRQEGRGCDAKMAFISAVKSEMAAILRKYYPQDMEQLKDVANTLSVGLQKLHAENTKLQEIRKNAAVKIQKIITELKDEVVRRRRRNE